MYQKQKNQRLTSIHCSKFENFSSCAIVVRTAVFPLPAAGYTTEHPETTIKTGVSSMT